MVKNGSPYWMGTLPEFARMVDVTYVAANYATATFTGISRNVHLVLPGQSDIDDPLGYDRPISNLLNELINLSQIDTSVKYLDRFDYYATHDYNDPWRILEYPQEIREWLEDNEASDLADKPFWITEFGVDHFTLEGDVEQARASAILQSLVYLLAQRGESGIENFFQYQLDNSGGTDSGLLWEGPNFDQQQRLAYTAMLQARTILGNATYGGMYDNPAEAPVENHQEVYFSSPDYERITVLWSTTADTEIEVSVPALYTDRVARLVWQDETPEVWLPTIDGHYLVNLPKAATTAVGGKVAFLLQDSDFPTLSPLFGADQDGDTIPDEVECPGLSACPDTDADGAPNYLDTDSDQDTILDKDEAACTEANGVTIGDGLFPCNSDVTDVLSPTLVMTDTLPDYLDLDSDGDGVFDLFEAGDQYTETLPVEGDIVNGIPAFRDPNERYIPALPSVQGGAACRPFADVPDAGVLPWGFDRGVACGLEMIRTTLAIAGITVTVEDPPVPAILFATTPYPRPAGGAQTVLTTTTAPATTPLAATFTTSHTVVSGELQAAWTTDTWVAAQFVTLTAPYAQLYDEHDTLLAAGPVQAAPADGDAALALALGAGLTCTVDGRGALSFYAPATAGLGVGGTWETYTASVAAPGAFGVGLQGATVIVDGQAFTGTLTLVVSDTLTLHGAGHTIAPNFVARVALTAQDAFVHLAAADAYDGYSGNLSISEHSAALDSVTFSGTYARSLAVAAVPAQSQVTPFETATFQATLSAVQGAAPATLPVTVTVIPPAGWLAAA